MDLVAIARVFSGSLSCGSLVLYWLVLFGASCVGLLPVVTNSYPSPCRSRGEGHRVLGRSTVRVSVHRLHVAYIAHCVRSSRVQCVHYVAYEHDTYLG